MAVSNCPYCGDTNISYLGIVEGSGTYADSLVEEWYCYDCNIHFASDDIRAHVIDIANQIEDDETFTNSNQ